MEKDFKQAINHQIHRVSREQDRPHVLESFSTSSNLLRNPTVLNFTFLPIPPAPYKGSKCSIVILKAAFLIT